MVSDAQVNSYLITDEEEVLLKTRVWEEMNKEYLDAQAEKAAAREEARRLAVERGEDVEDGVPTRSKRPSGSGSKRQRREAQEARAPGSAAEAAAAELRRNKLSSRINYDVVQILSQTLEEDAEHMPDAPGPVGSLGGGAAADGTTAASAAQPRQRGSGHRATAADDGAPSSPVGSDRFSETFSVLGDELREPTY